MKNMETWKFANENCGRRWWKLGWMMLFPTILIQIPFYGKSSDVVGWLGLAICIVECTVMVVSIIPTERALKEKFEEEQDDIDC